MMGHRENRDRTLVRNRFPERRPVQALDVFDDQSFARLRDPAERAFLEQHDTLEQLAGLLESVCGA